MDDFTRERNGRLANQAAFSSTLDSEEYMRFYQVCECKSPAPAVSSSNKIGDQLLQQSFSRPRRAAKFRQFLVYDCKLGEKAVSVLSKQMILALDFLVTDHIRGIVERATQLYDTQQSIEAPSLRWPKLIRSIINSERD
jgi:hypothetical protein